MSDTQHKNDMNLAATQQAVDKAAADKQNREAVLAAYQSSITDLLLNHKLGVRNVVKPDDQEAARISAISARSLTLVTVRRLDGDQKGFLIQFLYNAQLINQGHPIISLNTADLSRINLSGIKLRGINLSGAVMTGSDLSGADLTQAYLWGANLSKDSKANQQTNLKGATLIGAYLWGANLSDADLSGAKLSGADLSGTNLRDAIRDGVDFCYTIVTNDTCPPRPSSSGASDLGDDATMWSSFMAKQGEVPVPVHNVANVTAPSYDNNDQSDKRDNNGSALQVFLLGGGPYTNVKAYRSVSLDNTKTNFDLSLSFYITPFNVSEVPPIQALEFRVSSGPNATVALQWQQISATQSQQDNLPNWRVGNGTSWEDLKQSQQKLLAGKWYTLDLTGEIVGNEMHFLSFSCMNDFGAADDNVSSSLDRFLALSPNMKIGMQLDGNAHEDPYDVYLDGVDFNQT